MLPPSLTSSLESLPLMTSYGGLAFTVFQLLITATSFANEASGTPTAYSKFAGKLENGGVQFPSRQGMAILYGLPFASGLAACFWQHSLDLAVAPAALLCNAHFFKRCVEVFVVHEYSGSFPAMTAISIGSIYSVYSVVIASVATLNPSATSLAVGTVLFVVGFLGNLYHHVLLASLRSNPNNKGKYVVPSGGLFALVAAPHYLFELVAWLGIAVVSEHLNVLLVFTAMTSYLAGRSVAQNDWNRRKFEGEWPASRKNIVPMLF